MSEILYGQILKGHKYEVYYDFDDDFSDIDFASEDKRIEYTNKFVNEELSSFEVVKYRQCESCGHWIYVVGLCRLHFATPKEAFEDFINNYDEQ